MTGRGLGWLKRREDVLGPCEAVSRPDTEYSTSADNGKWAEWLTADLLVRTVKSSSASLSSDEFSIREAAVIGWPKEQHRCKVSTQYTTSYQPGVPAMHKGEHVVTSHGCGWGPCDLDGERPHTRIPPSDEDKGLHIHNMLFLVGLEEATMNALYR